ncbi:MAG: CBS domain-containing protein [Nitrospirota bacterium]|nr:CBS domain-containing protein [Nitrospirota bacterium]
MPVIYATSGNVEPYRAQTPPVPQDKVSAARESDSDARSSKEPQQRANPTLAAAQHAYHETLSATPQRKPALLAQDIMSAPVQSLPPEATLRTAWTLMKMKGFRHIPIVNPEGILTGIISDRDLMQFAGHLEQSSGASSTQHQFVQQVMTTKVVTATPITEITEIARVLLVEHISSLPIIDGANRPIGILTASDILRAIMRLASLELWT